MFDFSFVEQGMAGAILTNIPEDKTWFDKFFLHTGSHLGYGYKQGFGFLFSQDSFPRMPLLQGKCHEGAPTSFALV